MQVLFKYPRYLGGILYKPSKEYQMVPDKDAQGWFFDGLLKAGDISVKAEKPIEVSPSEMPQRIADPVEIKVTPKTKRNRKPKNENKSQLQKTPLN
jgi:hypothetical protein